MREIVWSINPKIDTLGDALPRMLHYASELLEAKDIELKAEITPEIESVKLNMEQRRDLYMIFKETVNNLAKHSKATQVNIQFELVDKKLIMVVSDNGTGFDTRAPLLNNGIRNMQERAQGHRWKLDIQSVFGAGTTITLKAQIA
jgi:signal transduction histidine kinase